MSQCIRCGAEIERKHRGAKYCFACMGKTNAESKINTRRVRAAIVRGELLPPWKHLCVDCGSQAELYDHRDYTKPLDVEPVCNRCNKLRGPAHSFNKEVA